LAVQYSLVVLTGKFLDHDPMDVGPEESAAGVVEGPFFVVAAEQVQEGTRRS
jgi:hypothetical protein